MNVVTLNSLHSGFIMTTPECKQNIVILNN